MHIDMYEIERLKCYIEYLVCLICEDVSLALIFPTCMDNVCTSLARC